MANAGTQSGLMKVLGYFGLDTGEKAAEAAEWILPYVGLMVLGLGGYVLLSVGTVLFYSERSMPRTPSREVLTEKQGRGVSEKAMGVDDADVVWKGDPEGGVPCAFETDCCAPLPRISPTTWVVGISPS